MKRNGKAVITALLLLFSALFLSGCWGKREVEQLAWVMALGVDEGAEQGTYLITYQVVLPKKGGDTGGTDSWTLSVEASSLAESMEKIYSILYKQPFMGSLKTVIFGDKLARDLGINQTVDFLQRNYTFRLTTNLIITPGLAKEVLNTQSRLDEPVSMAMMRLIENSGKASDIPKAAIDRYVALVFREEQGIVLPVIRLLPPDGSEVQYGAEGKEAQELGFKGAAVLKHGRLTGYLTEEETKGYMWLENQIKESIISTSLADGVKVTGNVTKASVESAAEKINGKIGIHYKIKASTTLQEIGGEQKMNLEEYKAFIARCEKRFGEKIKEDCEKALAKAIETKTDFLCLGRMVEEKYPEYWQEEKSQWPEVFPDLPVEIDVKVTNLYGGSSLNGPG